MSKATENDTKRSIWHSWKIEQLLNWNFEIDFLFLFICQFSNFDLLPLLIIICLYLSYRIVFTFTITILTLKTALMVAFIVDFNRMSGVKLVRYLSLSKFKDKKSKIKILDFSGYSDTLILRSSFVVSFLITCAIIPISSQEEISASSRPHLTANNSESTMALGSDEFFQILFVLFNIIGIAVSNRLFAGTASIIRTRLAKTHSCFDKSGFWTELSLVQVSRCRICPIEARGKKDCHRWSSMAEGPVLVLAMRKKHGPSALTACIVKYNAFWPRRNLFMSRCLGDIS